MHNQKSDMVEDFQLVSPNVKLSTDGCHLSVFRSSLPSESIINCGFAPLAILRLTAPFLRISANSSMIKKVKFDPARTDLFFQSHLRSMIKY